MQCSLIIITWVHYELFSFYYTEVETTDVTQDVKSGKVHY